MATKYYAVRKGRKTGIFTSWDDCKKSVSGYANAIYKSFSSMSEAQEYLYNNIKRESPNLESELQAYIDGSYDNQLKTYSYAVIIFFKGKKITFSKAEQEKELIELRNVAGELKAAMYVMDYAFNNKVKSMDLFFDYNGIEMWATGSWKANLPFTKMYSEYAQKIMKSIRINFIKIKSHTGNKYNEEVDQLAKLALYDKDESRKSIKDIDIAPEEYFESLKSTKASLDLGSYVLNNQVITQKDIYNYFKKLWKLKNRKIIEIKELKSYYDVKNNSFVIKVFTELDAQVIIIRGEEING